MGSEILSVRDETFFRVLRALERHPGASQRELARKIAEYAALQAEIADVRKEIDPE